jgi:hypothetical protein
MSILSASFEAVAWQRNSTLKPRMTELFQKIIDNHTDESFVRRVFLEINDLIFQETGLKFESTLVDRSWFFGPYEISVELPNLNTFSPVNPQAVKRMRNYDLDNLSIYDTITGRVDYSKGRVSGFFSTLIHRTSYSRKTFEGEIPANELAAANLHEVGHAYVNCAYMGETLATNVVLAELVGQYDMEADVKKKFLIGKAAIRMSGSPADIRDDYTAADITAFVLEGQVRRMQTSVGTRWYDQRLAETMADQFAVRFGAGADLVKAMSRFERSRHIWAGTGYDPKWLGVLFNFTNIVMLPFSISAEVAAPAVIQLLKQASKSFTFNFFLTGIGGELKGRMSGSNHAPLRERLQVIRRDVVSELKNPNLDEATRKLILNDLEVIDEEVATAHPFTDVYSQLSRWIVNVATGRKSEFGHQHMVDDLANNRLYEFSAKLKG